MFCSKCGSSLSADTAFCGNCGTPVAGSTLAAPPGPPPAVATYSPAPGIYISRAPTYAGFWLRFLAYLIDGFIVSVAALAVAIPLLFLTGTFTTLISLARTGETQPDPAAVAEIVAFAFTVTGLSVLIHWLYFAYLESGEKQAAWGKQILGVYVTDINGQRVSFARASGRFFAKFISSLIPLFIGYIMAGFTEKKQALHDMIASCLVLKR